ncbi:MAG: hypothetical protein EA341_18730 [Mongoliibacter sp.]|nr:MAG: hypothetical protein EA341_18730 [Mongoliibacter sp.]
MALFYQTGTCRYGESCKL